MKKEKILGSRGRKGDRHLPAARRLHGESMGAYQALETFRLDLSNGFYIKISEEGLEIGEAGSEGDPLGPIKDHDE